MSEHPAPVELIEKTRAYDGFFKIDRYRLRHRTPDGSMSDVITRENFERGHAAALMIYDRMRDMVLLIEEFRIGNYAAGLTGDAAWSLAPIAGGIEAGETPLQSAIREAREEAGIVLDEANIEGPLTYLSSPGGTSEILHIFVGFADISAQDDALISNDEDEFTRPVAVPRADLQKIILAGNAPASLVAATYLLDTSLRVAG